MKKEVHGVNVNYSVSGSSDLVVLLHGWGQNIHMMEQLNRGLKNYTVLNIDLPGFGESSEPVYAWSIYDYVECVHKLVLELGFQKCSLIGHSFGGKIALLYASMYDVNKLIVLGSPFKKMVEKDSLKVKTFKKLKKFPILKDMVEFVKKHSGSEDYRNSSGVMRDILVKHVNLDISNEVKKIACPCLIVWGDVDTTLDISLAYELEKLIPDAGVVVLHGTHYAYLENLNQMLNIIRVFMGE